MSNEPKVIIELSHGDAIRLDLLACEGTRHLTGKIEQDWRITDTIQAAMNATSRRGVFLLKDGTLTPAPKTRKGTVYPSLDCAEKRSYTESTDDPLNYNLNGGYDALIVEMPEEAQKPSRPLRLGDGEWRDPDSTEE